MQDLRSNPPPRGDFYDRIYQEQFKELKELYHKDSKIKKLYKKISSMNSEVLLRKIEIAKEKGFIVNSIEDLVCKNHPKSKFKPVKKFRKANILSSISKEYAKDFFIYGCLHEECEDAHLQKHSLGSIAYDCPFCGLVIGGYKIISKFIPAGEHNPFGGSTTEQYFCSICDTVLGYDIEKISK